MTNTQMTERLLATYRKYSPYESATPTPSDAGKKRFGTWAYANKYDALYDMYSQNKNFNADMWRESVSLGEQDNYLALLEQNKDNVLSNSFYDPQYYDYEAMMMELYLPVADDTKLETYAKDVFNAASGKWETEKFQMTQRQYLQYTLDNAREAERIEMQRNLEQERKDNLNFWQKLGHDTAATLGELGEGLLTGIVGAIDFVGGLGYALAMAPGEDTFADAFVRYFGEIGLTQMEKNTIRRALDEYERKNTHFRDIDGNLTNVGKYFVGISNSIGMMLPSILLAIPTGGTSLAFLPQLTFYTSLFSNSMYETATDPATKDSPSWTKILNVTAKTVAEVVIEKALGAVLGSTVQNSMLNIGRQNLSKIGNLTKGAGVKYLLKSAGQEGLEEFLQDFGTSCIDAFTGLWQEGYGREGINLQTLIDSFVCGAMSSIILSTGRVGLGAAASSIRNAKVAGSGDIVIEVDGEFQKVTGFTKLYYSQILSDFNGALNELKTGKFGTKKNFALAQEIYSGLTAISQFYSSFDRQRIKNCEMLLDRVVTNEKNEYTIKAKETTLEFAKSVESAFNDMFIGAQNTHRINSISEQIKKTLEKEQTKKKLEDGDVHEATTTSSMDTTVERNPDGTLKLRESEIGKKLEEALGKKKLTRLLELHQYYDNICTVDGHVAIADEDLLFVSESWLENYTSEEIYQFLVQDSTFEAIRTKKELVPIMDELKQFYKEFVGSSKTLTDEYMTSPDYAEEVLMNFFFNSSFYQAFILSNGGKNVHTHQKNIFLLYNFLFEQGKEWLKTHIHDQQVFNHIVGEIKKTWRDPTMKAIINWGLSPEALRADEVLSPRDLEYINLMADHKRVLHTMGNVGSPAERSAHVHLVDTILKEKGHLLPDDCRAVIERAQQPNASDNDITMARILFDILDVYVSRTSFIYDHRSQRARELEVLFNDISEENAESVLSEIFSTQRNELNEYAQRIFTKLFHQTHPELEKLIDEVIKKIPLRSNQMLFSSVWEENPFDTVANLSLGINPMTNQPIDESDTNIFGDVLSYFAEHKTLPVEVTADTFELINELILELEFEFEQTETSFSQNTRQVLFQESVQNMAFIIPHEAAELAMSGDRAGAQHVADCLNEFYKTYGIYPEDLLIGNIDGMSQTHITQLQTDMQTMGVADLFRFVQNRLEGMLGNDYVVVPKSVTTIPKQNAEIDALRQSDRTGIVVCRKMPASTLLVPELLDSSRSSEETDAVIIQLMKDHFFSREVEDATKRLLDNLETSGLDDWHIEMIREQLTDSTKTQTFYEALTLGFDPIIGELFVDIEAFANGASMADINEQTGEVNPLYILYEDLFNTLTTIELSSVINVDNFQDTALSELIKNYRLTFLNLASTGYAGWHSKSDEQIVVGLESADILNTLVHEINHLLESYFLHQYGMYQIHAFRNPEVLAYVVNNYRPLINFLDDGALVDVPDIVTKEWIENESKQRLRYAAADIIYRMAQGEIWARGATHNKNAKGFTTYFSSTNEKRLVAPDGTEFVYNLSTPNYKYNKITAPEPTPQMESALGEKLVDLWRYHQNATRDVTSLEKKFYTRPTYHTQINSNAYHFLSPLLSSTLGLFDKLSATLDDVIRDPQTYLRPDLLALMEGDFSEGNVYYRLKDYLEMESDEKRAEAEERGLPREPGISIDITKDGRYVFVNDNTFDDLLTDEMYDETESTDTTLYKKYGGKSEGIPLTVFYNKKELHKLGLDDIEVIIRPDVKSEAIFDREHPGGIIFLTADENITNAALIDKLNHEFRHVLQYRQGFARGFTPDIEVTQDMVNDLKKQAPDYFKNSLVRSFAERRKKPDETLDETITRYTIYFLSAGEQNAYAYDSQYLSLKPMLHRFEGGRVTIYMPWYNARTGEGRYTTKYLAMMSTDEGDSKKPVEITKKDLIPSRAKELTEEEIDKRVAKKQYAREHMPRKTVKPKHEGRSANLTPEGHIEHIYKYKNDRHFTKKKAEGTNLMYFYRVGEQNQMDPDLQNFVIDTTGHLDELPYSLAESIRQGTLTKQALFRFICSGDAGDPDSPNYINDETFALLKKHFFPNTPFSSIKDVDTFVMNRMSTYWAAVPFFYNMFSSVETLLEENTVEAFESYMSLVENSGLYDKIKARAADFGRVAIIGKDGKTQNLETYDHYYFDKDAYKEAVAKEEAKAKKAGRAPKYISQADFYKETEKKRPSDISELVDNWGAAARVLALQSFDGSLASAFYVAWNVRKTLPWQYKDRQLTSLDVSKETKRGKGDAAVANVAEGAQKMRGNTSLGNDILLIYTPRTVEDVDYDTMVEEVRFYLWNKMMTERVPDFAELSDKEQRQVAMKNADILTELTVILGDPEQVETIYADIKAGEAVGVEAESEVLTDVKENDRFRARVNVQTRAKNHGKKITKAIRDGYVTFEELPNEVKIMFKKVGATTDDGKKIETYELDPAFYEVGRGRVKLPGDKDIHHTRENYVPKHDITEGNDVFKHDTTEILKNERVLKSAWNAIKVLVRQRKKSATKGENARKVNVKDRTAAEKRMQETIDELLKTHKEEMSRVEKNARLKVADAEKRAREAERPIVNIQYTVKGTGDGKAKRGELTLLNVADNPDAIHMPERIREILSTSFSYEAETKVQWLSIDEDGNIYDKEKGPEDWESIKRHEVVDYNKFVDLNSELLLSLSRDDILDAVKALYYMIPESPSQLGKYNAFRLFLYGFFYAGINDGLYTGFSDEQKDAIRQIGEDFGSAMGIGLNALRQLRDTIRPREIGSRFLDDWKSVSANDKKVFVKMVENMLNEKNFTKQRARQRQIVNMLKGFAQRELAYERNMGRRWSKKWWSSVWKKVKTYRYLAMLSGPGTWVRNIMSNYLVKGLNNASDMIGALIFRKTDYSDGQWDLYGVQVSNEVKNFTKLYIEGNPSLKHAYELSGKYDKRGKLKKDADIAVAVITNAYLKYYRAENSPFVAKFIQKRMSDEKFVKTAARKYFNKMLTIEVENGNIDLADGLTGKVYALFADAVIQANEEYMHKRSVLADFIDDKFRARYPVATEAINFLFPFLNSGFNWFVEEAINLSPIGLVKGIGRSRKLEARIAELDAKRDVGEWTPNSRMAQYLARRDIGKGVIGTLLWTFGAILCLVGRLRIEEEKDKFYLNFGGDVRVDISNIFGSSSILIGASMVQPFVDGDDTTGFEAVLGYVTDTFLDGFFMADMMDRHQYDTNTWDFVGGEFNNALTSFIPQFVQVFVDGLDEQKIRYSKGFRGNWEYWLNSFVPTQPMGNKVINVYTGELEDKNALPIPAIGGLARRGLFGPKIYWVEVSEEERLCREYGANHNELSGEITVNKQTKKLDRISLNKKYGELNKASLATITSQKHKVQMPDGNYKTLHWDQLSDDQRKRVINRTFSDNAELAKIYTWTQVEGHKYYASASEWRDLKTLGITKNVYKGDKGFVE